MSGDNSYETKMLTTLQQQIALYQQALPIAKQLDANYGLDQSSEQMLDQLNQMVQQAAVHDAQILELKRANRQEPSEAIRVASNQLAGLIKEMLSLFGSLENKAQTLKERLSPQVTNQIQVQQMHAAYLQTPEASS